MIEIHLSNIYGDDMVFYGGESSAILHFRRDVKSELEDGAV